MSTLRDLVVSIDFDDTMKSIKDLNKIDTAVDEIEDSLKDMGAKINITSDDFNSMGKVGSSSFNGLSKASEKFAKDASKSLDDVEKKTKSTFKSIAKNASFLSLKGGGVTGLISGAVTGVAALTAGASGLASSLASAGIGAVAFGAVATSVLGEVFEASEEVAKIEEKIASADTMKERIEAQKELNALYSDMGEGQKGALKELQEFKNFWSDFTKQFEEPIFEAFGKSLDIAQDILKGLEPTISSVADSINDMLGRFDIKGMGGFFTWLEENASRSLENFAIIGGNLMSGFFSILEAFAPLGADMEKGLVGMTDKFKEWASSLSESDSFQTFVNYVKENGPKLISIVGDIIGVLGDIILTVAPLGGAITDAVSIAMKGISWFIEKAMIPLGNSIERIISGWKSFKELASNFKMPKIGMPKWMGGEGLIQVQGSHANGLESVPNDNYLANLHKSEAVLTATQANLLRSQGILSSNGDRPQINLGSQQPSQPASKNFSPTYNITIEGGNGNSNDIAEKVKEVVRKENDKFWYQMNLKSI